MCVLVDQATEYVGVALRELASVSSAWVRRSGVEHRWDHVAMS
jgi:hypothetical protein